MPKRYRCVLVYFNMFILLNILTIIRPSFVDTISAVPTIDDMPRLMSKAIYRGVTRCNNLMCRCLRWRVADKRTVFGRPPCFIYSSVRQCIFVGHVFEVFENMHTPAHAYLEERSIVSIQ